MTTFLQALSIIAACQQSYPPLTLPQYVSPACQQVSSALGQCYGDKQCAANYLTSGREDNGNTGVTVLRGPSK